MAYDIYYTMVFTDQGMGNLVTITRQGQMAVEANALIDFGSSRAGLATESIDFMVKYIRANRAAGKVVDFDLVVVSHQDNDHWNMFPRLFEGLAAAGMTPLVIGRFARGGPDATYGNWAWATVQQLQALSQTFIPIAQAPGSAYNPAGPLNPLLTVAQAGNHANWVQFKVVTVNAPATHGAPVDIVRNAASMMVAVIVSEEGETYNALLLPGDLTADTIVYFNGLPDTKDEAKDPRVLSLPHHGSHRTIADNYAAPAANRTLDLATAFGDWVLPSNLAISAGFCTHQHPYDEVIELFVDGILDANHHQYVSFSLMAGQYDAHPSDTGIYTNYTTIADKNGRTKPYHLIGTKQRTLFRIRHGSVVTSILDPATAPQPGVQ